MKKLILLIICLVYFIGIDGQTFSSKEERLEWWEDARFGMFIHWGPDAVASLQWKGQLWNEPGKPILYPAHESVLFIPPDEWEREVIGTFNPSAYDPEKWVLLAKQAGMKYIVLTTKHHNGFCLWPGLKGYDIRSTKYKKDPVEMFVKACRKYNIRVGFYFSQLDWHDPDAVGANTAKTFPDGWIANPDVFIPRMKAQISDLLTRYGKIDIIWFDGDWISDWTKEQGDDLTTFIRKIQPNIIINDRVGKRTANCGDFHTPEQEIPVNGLSGYYWETCMTMNDTWFYVKQDSNWKSSYSLISNLVTVASKGGNYLLNVGPDQKGVIPVASVERLISIGDWMNVNRESIYGTKPGPFTIAFPWGVVTCRENQLYLHILHYPSDNIIRLPFFDKQILRASVLGSKSSSMLKIDEENNNYTIHLPPNLSNKIIPVIKLKCR